MKIEEVTFDNFMDLDSKERKKILNDPELLKELVKKNVKPHRYEHSLSVADVCKKLAEKHNVDPKKAYMSGLLHDVCKFPEGDRSERLLEYLKYYDPDKIGTVEGAYHAWVAKYYLREKCNYHDSDILNAIYNHTICNSRDKLSIILYIADKREPLRKIDDDILEIAYSDLHKAFSMLERDVKKYIEGKNEKFVGNSL